MSTIDSIHDYGNIAGKIHADLLHSVIKKNPQYNILQLLMMQEEWVVEWFHFIELIAPIAERIEHILRWNKQEFVPRTVGKSRPSIYIWANIPEHIDTEVPDTRWIIVPLSNDGFIFRLWDEKINLHRWHLYSFDHALPHSVTSEEYAFWLEKWWKPFVTITGSIRPILWE